MIDKPPILKTKQIAKIMTEKVGWEITSWLEKEALKCQRDADAKYYEDKLEQVRAEVLEEVKIVVKDYYGMPGLDYIAKYEIDAEAYWNGEDGEGILLALKSETMPEKEKGR